MTHYLLDSHVLLWMHDSPEKLSENAKRVLLNTSNDLWLSLASLWELQIKIQSGKLKIDLDQMWSEQQRINGLQLLAINYRHVQQLFQLPFHHRDPFDRIIMAQARVEQFSILSVDDVFAKYPVVTVW